MKTLILKTTDLTKRYKQQTVLDRVGLTIHKGDIYGLVGQNGSGKTTLMRVIAGHSLADHGEICLLGESGRTELRKARRRIGAVIETPAFYPNLTAEQNLEYYRMQRGVADRACISQLLEMVNLAHAGQKKYKDFSLGMKQRLGLALSLLGNPDFLILDEPVNGLDPTGVIEIREVLKRLNAEGITMMISSHILPELSHIATRYGFIHKGKLIKELDSRELDEASKQSIHIQVDDAAKAIAVLEQKLGIADYKVISASEIRVYEWTRTISEITKQLVLHEVALNSIVKVGENLEEYYTALLKEAE